MLKGRKCNLVGVTNGEQETKKKQTSYEDDQPPDQLRHRQKTSLLLLLHLLFPSSSFFSRFFTMNDIQWLKVNGTAVVFLPNISFGKRKGREIIIQRMHVMHVLATA